ncbi:uncharacterized protein LOC123515077 [Portunus trituberculatus]|uniref:uncharacterized protein LOC123515077 n=1 Tax=Portunus trituberculatus TaxID=210409 RepID=UPI001E1CFB31|nr:uncharacterized protein LOC123515077 [Portunus trituberculatus]XP_045129426.1 uncharacterized protein LOC123515077 [Portunus trituberculatus]XP_045129427.1 uncharacterized protein LOC123515077 [Portunus trituberculatus]
MATKQLVRSAQTTDTWSLVFPAEQRTLQHSEAFVRKLLALGISSITYLRNIFPEKSYYEQHLDGLKLKLLIDNSSCRASNMVVSWMRGCFQAIERKYLKRLVLAILNRDNLKETYETYTYKFRYTDDGPVMTSPGGPEIAIQGEDTRRATQKMLRTILFLTQNMKPLPKNICLSMKLTYYDEVTPKDYEPPCFSPVIESDFTFSSKPVLIKVGDVSTKFHSMKLYVCIEKNAYLSGENSPTELQTQEGSQDEKEETETDRKLVRSYYKFWKPLHSSSVSDQSVPLTQSQKDDHLVPTQTLLSGEVESSHNDMVAHSTQEDDSGNSKCESFPVRCPCGVQCDDGLMVLCDICQKWQHGICFGIFLAIDVKDGMHVCEQCATPSQPCTDPTLPKQPELATFCLFRRTLSLLQDSLAHGKRKSITATYLAQMLGVNITMGTFIFKKLKDEKIIYTKRKINYIDSHMITFKVFTKYLPSHGYTRRMSSQEMLDITSQTSQSSKSGANADTDATPDLDLSSVQESSMEQKSRQKTESVNNSLDETVDIVSLTQDVTVGTQNILLSSRPSVELSQNSSPSEALATAGNTMQMLESLNGSQKIQELLPTSMPLHSGMDVEEGSSELVELQEPSEDREGGVKKLSLARKAKQDKGRPKRKTLSLNNFEDHGSQNSDILIKNSISQDSEVSKKKKKIYP